MTASPEISRSEHQANATRNALEVADLVAGYGDLDICQGVSLRVGLGEFVALIGPNGSGKSTLLKAIFGLIRLRAGSVIFMGENVSNWQPNVLVGQGMAYCPQTDNVFPGMTIQENLEMGAYVRARVPADRLDYVYQLFPDLAAKRQERARGLSGGQRQMLALGRALMLDPRALLLDEPSAGLSPRLVDIVLERVAEIHRAGTSVLLVEQNAKRALELADRAYVLAAGRTRLEGTGAGLLQDEEVGRLYLGTAAGIRDSQNP